MYKQIIQNLKDLDLSKRPEKEIIENLSKFGVVGWIGINFHPGKAIIRARPHSDENDVFDEAHQLSYKPQKFNKTYQRASTPNKTMFYGAVIPDEVTDEIDNYRITALLEASQTMRNNLENGNEKITFGKWVVKKDITLLAMVYHDDFIRNSVETRQVYNAYQALMQQYPEMIEKTTTITEYLASEFAKPIEDGNDFEYMISANFTELIAKKRFAGIYYPSYRTEGKGFNVAISPEYVDECLELEVAGECRLIKKGLNSNVYNERLGLWNNEKSKLIYEKI